jgi:hypothetical protein
LQFRLRLWIVMTVNDQDGGNLRKRPQPRLVASGQVEVRANEHAASAFIHQVLDPVALAVQRASHVRIHGFRRRREVAQRPAQSVDPRSAELLPIASGLHLTPRLRVAEIGRIAALCDVVTQHLSIALPLGVGKEVGLNRTKLRRKTGLCGKRIPVGFV